MTKKSKTLQGVSHKVNLVDKHHKIKNILCVTHTGGSKFQEIMTKVELINLYIINDN